MRTFLLKVKHFFKRNIYPITVSVCTILILTIVTVSAYNSIKGTDDVPIVDTPTNVPIEEPIIETGKVDDEVKDDDNKTPIVKPTTSTETIIFDLPFNGAMVTKAYAEDYHLYDATSDYWQTHQGLDFACVEGTQAKAVYAGKISKIENSMIEGTIIYLQISDELTVVYKGLSSKLSVKEGDRVEKGAILGTINGFINEKLEGVHLHLELLKKDVLVDPTEYFAFNK